MSLRMAGNCIGLQSVFVLAKVVSIRDKFFYPCCTKCRKKLHVRCSDDSTFFCKWCMKEYKAESIQYRYRISVLVSDRTQLVQITVFGSCLDQFFGSSATFFARYVNGQMFDASSMKWSNLIYRAVQQCFVGTLIQFGFRICSASRTTSQTTRNSPFHLKNVVKYLHPSKYRTYQVKGLPNLVACQILPCCDSNQQIPTVRQILKEWLQVLQHNPEEFSMRTSEASLVIDNSKYGGCNPEEMASHGQVQRESFIYCSQQEYFPLISPLILTGQSQPSAESFHMQETPKASNKTQLTGQSQPSAESFHMQETPKASNKTQLTHPYVILTDKENHTHKANATFPQVNELVTAKQVSSTSQSKNLDTSYWLNCESLVDEWTELDDFPSSEDLSAFLADLDAIAIGKIDPSLRTPSTKDGHLAQFSVTQGRITSTLRQNDMMTSTTFKDELSNLFQTTVERDNISLEDLYAVLVDSELGCDNIAAKMLSPPANHEVKTFLSRFTCAKHDVDDIIKRDDVHMKNAQSLVARNSKEWTDGDRSVSPRVECSITPCLITSKGKGYEDKSSGSRIMMNCKRVLSELFEDDSSKDDNCIGTSLISEFTESNQEHTRQTEQFFLCESADEMSLGHGNNRVQLYGFSANETNLRNSTRSGKQTIDDETDSKASMSGYDLSISTSPVLFSQSVSRIDGNLCSETQEQFISQGSIDDESTSCWTPDLFPSLRILSDYTRSFNGQEMNSTPLFSCSENSYGSSSLSDSSRALMASPPVSSATMPDPLSIKSTFQFQNQFHSTPMMACLPTRIGRQASTKILDSPLIQSTGLYDEISFQGSPILFSPMSNTSCS